jgi:hypothetical protein
MCDSYGIKISQVMCDLDLSRISPITCFGDEVASLGLRCRRVPADFVGLGRMCYHV